MYWHGPKALEKVGLRPAFFLQGDQVLRQVPVGIFKDRLPLHERKEERTSRIAREILDSEAATRAAKNERLRAARLERENS